MDNLFKSLEQVKEEQDKEIQVENNMTLYKSNFTLTKEEVESLGWQYKYIDEGLHKFNQRNGHRLTIDFTIGQVRLTQMNEEIIMYIKSKEDLQKLNSILYI